MRTNIGFFYLFNDESGKEADAIIVALTGNPHFPNPHLASRERGRV